MARNRGCGLLQAVSELPVLSAVLVIAHRPAIRRTAQDLFRAFLRYFPSEGTMSAVMRGRFFQSKLAYNLCQ
jgi:hypothetical protein